MTPTPTPTNSVSVNQEVSGTVPFVLSLRLSNQLAQFGSITPGLARDYDTTVPALVTSTAGNATLSVADVSDGSGRLTNGTTALASALLVRATNAASPNTAFAPLTAQPGDPAELEQLDLQRRGDDRPAAADRATEPLTAGGYSKTILLTLSTTQP